MELNKIVQGVNGKLAGELFTFDMIKEYMDDVIDDINSRLNTAFPTFSSFTHTAYPPDPSNPEAHVYPNYDFFPDAYIRKVVIVGAAYKYYITDEEGIDTARSYGYIYENGLFLMERDYLDQVPEEFVADNSGSIQTGEFGIGEAPYKFNDLW